MQLTHALNASHITFNLSQPRIHASAVPLDGHRVMVVGGKTPTGLSDAIDVFDEKFSNVLVR